MNHVKPTRKPIRGRAVNPQPLHVLDLPDALLCLDTLGKASGLSIATLYRKAKAGELKLVKLGRRCTRVRSADARDFLRRLGTAG